MAATPRRDCARPTTTLAQHSREKRAVKRPDLFCRSTSLSHSVRPSSARSVDVWRGAMQKNLRLPEVEAVTGLKKPTIYELMAAGRLAKPHEVRVKAAVWLRCQ